VLSNADSPIGELIARLKPSVQSNNQFAKSPNLQSATLFNLSICDLQLQIR
jgi:hypothetical protein